MHELLLTYDGKTGAFKMKPSPDLPVPVASWMLTLAQKRLLDSVDNRVPASPPPPPNPLAALAQALTASAAGPHVPNTGP